MGPRIAIVGGGSHQWAPTLVTDMAGRAALQDADIVLDDIDAARLPRMAAYVEHLARVDAALSGRRDDVLAALLADPLTGRADYDRVEQMTDELLAATRPGLPQFG